MEQQGNAVQDTSDRKQMIQNGFDTVASGYTYKDVGVTVNAGRNWQ